MIPQTNTKFTGVYLLGVVHVTCSSSPNAKILRYMAASYPAIATTSSCLYRKLGIIHPHTLLGRAFGLLRFVRMYLKDSFAQDTVFGYKYYSATS